MRSRHEWFLKSHSVILHLLLYASRVILRGLNSAVSRPQPVKQHIWHFKQTRQAVRQTASSNKQSRSCLRWFAAELESFSQGLCCWWTDVSRCSRSPVRANDCHETLCNRCPWSQGLMDSPLVCVCACKQCMWRGRIVQNSMLFLLFLHY